jgi:hypothetical protein
MMQAPGGSNRAQKMVKDNDVLLVRRNAQNEQVVIVTHIFDVVLHCLNGIDGGFQIGEVQLPNLDGGQNSLVFPCLVMSLNTSSLSPDAHIPSSFHSFIIKLQFISYMLHNYQNVGKAKLYGNQILMVGMTAYFLVKARGC